MEDKWPSVRNPPTNSELELFTRELTWDTRRTLSKVYAPMWMGGMGFVLACATNWFNRKPMLSGIQKHIAFTAIGIPLGLYMDQWKDGRNARRDAELVYYMQTHPQDFPERERIKWKNVVDKWVPFR